MKILLVVGTRPQIIKSVPIVHEAIRRDLELKIIHTGQHYDHSMSDIFFENFAIPKPSYNLGVGSGTHGYQTGEIIMRLEKILLKERPDLVVVPGDTNSALASALSTVKLSIPLAHVEAGARSYNMTMQEEINRRVIDHTSTLLFAVSQNCKENLSRENVLGRVTVSGDTMYDVCQQYLPKIREDDILEKLKLASKEYSVLTLHREGNVEDIGRLSSVMEAITTLNIRVVFPIHPRTRKKLEQQGIKSQKLMIIDPVDYFSMMKLVRESSFVLTDSGGLQKEAFWSKVPCVTLRNETEWVETVKERVNVLTGANKNRIIEAVNNIIHNYSFFESKLKSAKNPYYYGGAGNIIMTASMQYLKKISNK